VGLTTGHPGTKASRSRGARKAPPPAYGKRQNAAGAGVLLLLCAGLLRLARLLERPMDRQAAVSSKTAKGDDRASTKFASSGTPIPLNASRERCSLMGSRSVDLVKGLSSPLLCAPARRPAHLLATWHRLVSAACCLSTCSAPAWHLPGTYLAFAWHLLRGTTSSLPSGLACVPQLPALVLVRPLGAPPTGGTHSASQTHLLRRSNCTRATAVSINTQSSI
jgi:hypothetical protein